MKKIHRVFAMLMAAIMALSLVTTAFAAEPTICLLYTSDAADE